MIALSAAIRDGRYDEEFARLYGADQVDAQRARYLAAVDGFVATYGDEGELMLFSAPGRTEIGGNHTDHENGRVIAGSVDMDIIAVVRRAEGRIRVQSQGYPMDDISLDTLTPMESEINSSAALIRGTAAGLVADGYAVGGFEAYTTSNVLKGSGLSSSAAFEVLIGVILNHLYNDGAISAVKIAQVAQYAENVFFGKPSGLMDQMASSVGNVIAIDFADPAEPIIEQLDCDFAAQGYALCIVDVGGDHADLTHEYAAVPAEMKAVAASLGGEVLRDTDEAAFVAALPTLRRTHGDRAVLRALHFYEENARVADQVSALRTGDMPRFLSLVLASGYSSLAHLQNVFASSLPHQQGMTLALATARRVLDGCGAWRVHGGGFGGTTQNYVPLDKLDEFTAAMERVFGDGSCHVLRIRPCGGVRLRPRI